MFKYIVTLICFWIINIGYIYANTSINNNLEDKIKNLIIKHLSIKETTSIDKLIEPYSTEKIFFHAVSYGQIDIVKQLIKDINMKQLKESLNISIINGYDNIAEIIIKQGIKVNFSIDSGTPLGIASSKGNLTIVKQLLDAGAKYDIKDNDNKMPIYHAIDHNQLSIIKHFIKTGIDINSFKTPETPLIYALENGKIDIANFLFESGAKYNNSDLEGLIGPYSNNYSILKNIFQTNIPFDVNYVQGGCSCGSSGECYCDYITPIHTAVKANDLVLTKFLIKKGADINFQVCIEESGGEELYEENCWKRSPIELAASDGNLKIIKYLANKGADINYFVLLAAVKNRHIDVVDFLLKLGIDVYHKGEDNDDNALHFAEKINIGKLLIL
ncbi:MAG: hypothetical protein OMM_04252 [Candidatus Magnetoglobus multicellularis str. Araruama]|uniref:Uncharacterized protein n=1 Tax=Candidatus Magnetoglobus multicellularis str. Araruama TaxID=890399 RepID=A0A1V1P2I7_9BACT|nr:MAG: hypothetical protein OMM_04252 [Candidatus Magnetoglobus multicellularis str. Araruama]